MGSRSHFASLLGTNYVATDKERVQITAYISESTAQLASLQTEASHIYTSYVELQQQQETLLKTIEDHRALMAPIRRLPVDVLREIFLHCLPQTHNAIISRHECPVLLGQICSRWRLIILDTAALWASIHVPIPDEDIPMRSTMESTIQIASQRIIAVAVAQRRARAIAEWLGRSGESWARKADPSLIRDIMFDALIPFASRWGALSCETPAFSLTRICALPPSALPRLHSLKIYGPLGGFPLEMPLAASGIIQAPRLRNLEYIHAMENPTQFPLSFSQLTTLSIHSHGGGQAAKYLTVEHLVRLLLNCPLLRDCRLDVAFERRHANTTPADPPDHIPASIPLLHLTQFYIDAEKADLSPLFDALDVPVLAKLEYHAGWNTSVPLLTLLLRTADTLRTLTLDPRFFSRSELDACLCVCAGLSNLTFRRGEHSSNSVPPRGVFMTNGTWMQIPHNLNTGTANRSPLDDQLLQLLGLLEGSDTGEVLLPNLKVFECSLKSQFSDAAVLAFLKARLTSLQSVNITFARPQGFSMKTELESFAQHHGITCKLSYSPPPVQISYLASDGINTDMYMGRPRIFSDTD